MLSTPSRLSADPKINETLNLGAISSINWEQSSHRPHITFHAYFTLKKFPTYKPNQKVRFVVLTWNFGNILAGYFAKRIGLPADRLVVVANENE
jgi:threonine synthase